MGKFSACMRKLIIAVVLITASISTCALAQSQFGEPKVVWPTYHMDSFRKGQNKDCTDITNPASLNLIWVFPRGISTKLDDEEKATVDDAECLNYSWPRDRLLSLTSEDSWGEGIKVTPAISRSDTNAASNQGYFRWEFPSDIPKGRYQIMIWVPTTYNERRPNVPEGKPYRNTTQAEYIVRDKSGETKYKFDQTIGSREWRLLTTRHFDFSGDGEYYIQLSNVTDDSKESIEENNIVVVADAIKFVPTTGMEIHASVASAEIPWRGEWDEFKDKNSLGQEITIPAGSYSGMVQAVYACTVELPVANSQSASEVGAVYCINSVTPTTEAYNKGQGDSWERNWALSKKFLGEPIWRYPREPSQRLNGSTVSGFSVPPNEIEGPIQGGIYASPTLARIIEPDGTTSRLVCYVAGMDMQVYALDAVTGELLWKGPGVTLGEKSPTSTLKQGATPISPAEAFGGEYHIVRCSGAENPQDAVVWEFTDELRKNSGGEPDEGLAYKVFVWIPPVPIDVQGDPLEVKERAREATYTITYVDFDGSDKEVKVRFDQSNVDNHGRWVQLGSSYFNVKKVSLSTVTTAIDPGKTASDYIVVVDACMIVPNTIDAFGYCTPVVDIDVDPNAEPKPSAQNVFLVTASGRALAFDARPTNPHKIGKLKWIYPKVRTKRKVTGDADIDDPSMGAIGASPAYWNNRLYIAGLDGRIRRLENVRGASFENLPVEAWVWPKEDSDTMRFVGFTSSPAIDKDYQQFVIGSTQGIFYCFSTEATTDSTFDGLFWKYPDIDESRPSRQLPLGAFRYSTAAIASLPNQPRRAWIGSTDGKIYSFDISEPNNPSKERRLRVEFNDDGTVKAVHGRWYLEPNTLSTIQGSVALTGPDNQNNEVIMFVGDMRDKGVLHWYSADKGTSTWEYNGKSYTGWQCEGQLFSSPNLTNFEVGTTKVSYVYCGCSDGRVYAWSREGGAWGGRWAGGDWPFEGNPDDRSQMQTALSQDTDIQFDVFPYDFWKACKDYADNCNPIKNDAEGKKRHILPDVWPPQWPPSNPNDKWPPIISREMKQPTASLSGKTDDEINRELLKYARERRNYVFPDKNSRLANQPLYLEWGERLHLIVWNLPSLASLYPYTDPPNEGAKRAHIRFTLVNQSPGSSSGSEIRFSGSFGVLKEYTVLDKEPKTAYAGSNNTQPFTYYEPLKYSNGDEVKRCFALVELERELRGDQSNPPTPGPGWKLIVELRRFPPGTQPGKDKPFETLTIPLSRLKPGSATESMGAPVPVTKPASETGTRVNYDPQDIGINNPLAINTGSGELAWSYTPNRNDPQAHFNGNGAFNQSGEFFYSQLVLDLETVAHGTTSPIKRLGVMDRSGIGLVYPAQGSTLAGQIQKKIERFRITSADLRWTGGTAQIQASGGFFFPWEFRPESADYPHIYKRHQRFQKYFDDADPSRAHTTLPPLILDPNAPASYERARLRSDTVEVTVNVPRFQPANTRGYQAVLQAYVDSDGDGNFDSGNITSGRPSLRQEAYREFMLTVKVPPDPKIEVEEQLIDIGRVPHGFGYYLNPPPAGPGDFTAVNPHPAIKQFFKRVTIKNAGNVNLYNVRIGHPDVPLYLMKDPAEYGRSLPSSPVLPGWEVRSTLDPIIPTLPYLQAMKGEPFITSFAGQNLGYTITKPRVGDPDPSIMSVPDARKWDMDYGQTKAAARAAYQAALIGSGLNPADADSMKPFPTEVSVTVPVGQPVGTYVAPFVPVYAYFGNPSNPITAYAAPTFGLKVTVRENQVTGDVFPAILGQIDTDSRSKFGDSTPAAFRDVQTGNVHLFWSSNRPFDPAIRAILATASPNDPRLQEFASAPWFINRALLAWDQRSNNWVPAGSQMWGVPQPNENPYLPLFPDTNKQWPPLIGSAPGREVMEWKFGGRPTGLQSVRHHSPFIGENLDVPPDANAGRTWLAWAGMANVVDADGKISHEYRIFYTDATHGNVTASDRKIYSIEHDPKVDKRYPCVSVFDRGDGNHRMWMFWQGGESGKWSIYYSVNNQAPAFPNTVPNSGDPPADAWSPDVKLRTPDCLTSVSSPNAVHRQFWVDLTKNSPITAGSKHLFDVVYAGINKLYRTADIMLSRYAAVAPGDPYIDSSPGRRAQPMPRVFGEKLVRDPKFGFFTSKHLAWVRLDPRRVAEGLDAPMLDDWGRYDFNKLNPDLPFIRVYFPKGYEVDSQTTLPPGSFVSGTDGRVIGPDGTVIYAPPAPLRLDNAATEADFRLEIDQATGVYAYKYPKDSLTQKILGEMLVDFSAGVVRFTNPLKEIRNPDGTVTAPEVMADYTPQTWRLTTDLAVDDSPRAFIERTLMNKAANPGMCDWLTSSGDPKPAYVDRLWVLWRKAGTAIESSTIFWKTFRVGVDLSKLEWRDSSGNVVPFAPFPMKVDGTWNGQLIVRNNLGPFEVDKSGTRIYFTQVDERYRSLFKVGSRLFFTDPQPPTAVWNGTVPVPIEIEYTANGVLRKAEAYDVFWLEELPEQSLFGFVGSASVNEGSVYAFADMYPEKVHIPSNMGTREEVRPYSKIWVFWTTTSGGTTDLCWANLSPNFSAR